jgi:hypothetical protein
MINIKKIHIWESEGFWVIDFYQGTEIDGNESLKICTRTNPEIIYQPRYKQPQIINADLVKSKP